jgi:hypothetical protein
MKILIIHNIEDSRVVRRTSLNHAFCLMKYAPDHEYALQCYGQPIPERLRRERFDAILLDTTFLCWRWAEPRERYLDRLVEEYAFVRDSDAVKIALPQDEYDHTELLDAWLAEWRVDVIYSVCYEHRSVFYPRAAAYAEIREGLTGFVDDADVELVDKVARPFAEREIDVGYRARKLPPQFGSFGLRKAAIGERFLRHMAGTQLRLDISLRPEDVLNGDEWLRFLGNSRFTLGCESGSSLLDPRGEIRRRVLNYMAEHPDAPFEEVEAKCFPGEDRRFIFCAISPRIFETTMARSCNILVPGRYLNVLRPHEHYIPLAEDLSNAEEVLDAMCDTHGVRDRIEACYATLISSGRYRYSTFKDELLEAIDVHRRRKGLPPAGRSMTALPGERQINPLIRHAFLQQSLRIAEAAAGDLRVLGERLSATEAELHTFRQSTASQAAGHIAGKPMSATHKVAGVVGKVPGSRWEILSRGRSFFGGLYRRLRIGRS